ncbi:MAG: iron-sulfur cluster repair di-iron protein [Cyclobacteriaceae bacterium]
MLQKNIIRLIDENFIYARALHYLGIEFMDFADKTLMEVCRQKQINADMVLKTFDSFLSSSPTENTDLNNYPIGLIVGYLKHSHHTFIKDRLPYIHHLISGLNIDKHCDATIKDLHLIFPVFLEDFIKHIYEEEDTLFGHILNLEKFNVDDPRSVSNVVMGINNHSLQSIYDEHCDEDEMEGLREMTDCIRESGANDIVIRTIVAELQAFDVELNNHAQIENEILFPKAISLENRVITKLESLSKLN